MADNFQLFSFSVAENVAASAEYEIYQHFDELVAGKTSIYISHRMSSCRFCDQIYVFDNGRIVEQGSHDELMNNLDGLYCKLWESQAQYYKV